jgi:hypothetical protein
LLTTGKNTMSAAARMTRIGSNGTRTRWRIDGTSPNEHRSSGITGSRL